MIPIRRKDQVAIGPQGANKSRSKLQPKRRSVELKQASQLRRDDGKISRREEREKCNEVIFPCSLEVFFVRARHTPIWGNREKEIGR